jgi:hypothetical protein
MPRQLPMSHITKMIGGYEATICVVAMPEAQVKAMLRPDLELAPQQLTPPSTHPVIFGFGRHSDVHLIHLERLWNQGYLEQFVGVPFTRLKAGLLRGPNQANFYFLPRLFLDRYIPVLGGVLWWGLPKRLSKVSTDDRRYQVRSLSGQEDIISLDIMSRDDHGQYADFPHLAPIAEMISQPLLGKSLNEFGPWVGSTFDWRWPHAEIWSVEASMKISEPFLPGLKPAIYELPGIWDTPLGAFGVRTNWEYSLPYLPSRVAPDSA